MKKIEKSKMSKLIGGGWVQTTSSTKKFTNANGETCVMTTTDGYNDENNNGKWDKGEVRTSCSDINCNVN